MPEVLALLILCIGFCWLPQLVHCSGLLQPLIYNDFCYACWDILSDFAFTCWGSMSGFPGLWLPISECWPFKDLLQAWPWLVVIYNLHHDQMLTISLLNMAKHIPPTVLGLLVVGNWHIMAATVLEVYKLNKINYKALHGHVFTKL